MKRTIVLLTTFFYCPVTYSQTWTGTSLEVIHPTLGQNGDATVISRNDDYSDAARLRIKMGDEESSLFEIGYNYYANGQWFSNFTVDGSGNSFMKGNVGIGISTPSYKLQVSGGDIGLDADQPLRGGGKWLISGNASAVTVGTANTGVGLRLFAGADDPRMLINGTTGNVGIGTLISDQLLTVNGTIHSKEVKVDLSVPAPDYVFEKEYKLSSLERIKTFIDENKHLPEVPSAKEMEANGVQLGEMNMLLLKKIEELTLYIIEQNKRIENLEKKIN